MRLCRAATGCRLTRTRRLVIHAVLPALSRNAPARALVGQDVSQLFDSEKFYRGSGNTGGRWNGVRATPLARVSDGRSCLLNSGRSVGCHCARTQRVLFFACDAPSSITTLELRSTSHDAASVPAGLYREAGYC
jgi:hypothetical protein